MPAELPYKNWKDIIDQEKYSLTGIAALYRNPQFNELADSSKYDSANFVYSLDPGENYLFNQKPVAYGFTAYIGHEEIKSGENSLRSNRKNDKLGFKSIDYYHNYSAKLLEIYSINDKKKARPKSDKKLQIDFYTELLSTEHKLYEESEKFYSESQNEVDHTEKANLREYVDAFFEWIEDKLIDLNPNENQLKGLGGLRDVEAEYIYKEFKGIYIHSKTKQEHFVAIFQNFILPDGWKRVEWMGKKSALFSFMDQVFSPALKPGKIKMYFKVDDDHLHGHFRTITTNTNIKNIVDHAKTLRPRR